MTSPLIILHRRNRIDQLKDLPAGCWVEVDVDLRDGVACVGHDSMAGQPVLTLEDYLTHAIKRGVTGFAFDCKREHAEKAVQPLLSAHKIVDYFYLNEIETVADRFLAVSRDHRSAIRVWQYHGAYDVIRYAGDMKAETQSFPGWVWVDCWRRGLIEDIGNAFIPLSQSDAQKLHQLGVKLCICSPELYAHDYDKTYTPDELQAIYRGVVAYRHSLIKNGISFAAVCTKFPWLWIKDIDPLLSAKELGA